MCDHDLMRRLFFLIGLILSVLLLVAPAWSGKPDLQIQFLDKGPTVPNPPRTDRPTIFYALVELLEGRTPDLRSRTRFGA